MKPIISVDSIQDPYTKRILSYTLRKDAFKMFSSTPARIQRAVRGLNNKDAVTPLAKGKWSIAQIIAHLYDAEFVASWRLRMAIAQSGSTIQAFDENRWAEVFKYENAGWKQMLSDFVTIRKANIRLLKSLNPKQWKHYGIHEERGKETVERMVQMFAGHDFNHVKQIENIVKMKSTK